MITLHHGLLFTNENKDSIIASAIAISAPRNKNMDYVHNAFVCDENNVDMVIDMSLLKIIDGREKVPECIIIVGLDPGLDTLSNLMAFREKYGSVILLFNIKNNKNDSFDFIKLKECSSVTKCVYSFYADISGSNNYVNKFNSISNTVEESNIESRLSMCFKPYNTLKNLVEDFSDKNGYIVFRWPD